MSYVSTAEVSAISQLKFPFLLKKDQIEAVQAWIENNFRGTILYSTGTGKTEIAFECAKKGASTFDSPIPISIIILTILYYQVVYFRSE